MEEIKHMVQLRERKILELTGILSVVSFRDRETEFESNMGHLQITGEDLHMEKLDLEQGEVVLSGKINSLYYPDDSAPQSKGSLLRRFFG